ncbi:MAG: 16S rRNA (uracil(1498)-N(3))-methyltransferase [Micrococcales bacterium]|nr:16S rRNA (uracil(1498)-N(3))-methyltransferase [Micrococcales bacterium]
MAWLYLGELPDAVAIGDRVRLDGDEARHAVHVARARVGERLAIGDGAGRVALGIVTGVADAELRLEVEELRIEPVPNPELWLVQALAKGDRDELAIQAATELGASGIVPWAAERSVTRWEGPKAAKAHARWAAIVREAAKQAIRSRVPVVAPLARLGDLARMPGAVLVLEPTASASISSVDLPTEGRIALVVGPEGGVTPRELDALSAVGAVPVRLGPEVLRTSTAGPAALTALNLRLGRW